MKSLRRTEYIDLGGPGTGGVEGFNDISIHNTILNRNSENGLRRNTHNWGTNILKIPFFNKIRIPNRFRFLASFTDMSFQIPENGHT